MMVFSLILKTFSDDSYMYIYISIIWHFEFNVLNIKVMFHKMKSLENLLLIFKIDKRNNRIPKWFYFLKCSPNYKGSVSKGKLDKEAVWITFLQCTMDKLMIIRSRKGKWMRSTSNLDTVKVSNSECRRGLNFKHQEMKFMNWRRPGLVHCEWNHTCFDGSSFLFFYFCDYFF